MELFNQELNNNVWNFSPFQIATAQEIEQLDEFDKFVSINYSTSETPMFVRKKGPWVMTWYDKNGILHAWRVGVNKILQQVDPAPID